MPLAGDAPRMIRKCQCCDGTGEVRDIDDRPRPCSRCRVEEFHAWADARRPAAKGGRAMKPPPTVTLDDLSREELRTLVDRLRERHLLRLDPVDLLEIRRDTLWKRAGEALRQCGEADRERVAAVSSLPRAKSARALDRAALAGSKASQRSRRQFASYLRLSRASEAVSRRIEELLVR